MQSGIICADAAEWLADCPDDTFDLVFTSPPYNFKMSYDTHEDDMDWQDYLDWLTDIFWDCRRVLKHGGRLVINIQPRFSEYVPVHSLITQHLMEHGLLWKTEIIWEKNIHTSRASSTWGSWCSPSAPYYMATWEYVLVFCKGDRKNPAKGRVSDLTPEEFKAWVYGRWTIPGVSKALERTGHPAPFPEELATRVIKMNSYVGDMVLDPFGGTGTTALVAKRLGRRYVSIDISEDYTARARARVSPDQEDLF